MELKSIQDARRISDGKWVEVQGISGLKFIIKPYQRGYRWGKGNAEKLLKDIEKYVTKEVENPLSLLEYISSTSQKNDNAEIYDFYCLQALSIKQIELETSEAVNTQTSASYELIDGQQRLTTIFLIYELLDTFINPKDDRLDKSPYSIAYSRDGKFEYDLTQQIHDVVAFDLNNISPRKAYRKGFGKRDAEWFKDYKLELKEKIRRLKLGAQSDSLSLDLYYISEVAETIIDFIYDYRDDEGNDSNLNRFFQFIKQDVLFLWYEIPSNVSAETEFAGLNSNKISLTNAELIKALVLKMDTRGQVFENAGHRWDALEQGLCQRELWSFISNEDRATRIDLLLEIFARSNDLFKYDPDPKNEYALFDWYEALYGFYSTTDNPQYAFSKHVIEGIENIYSRTCEWYDDVDIYHYIGLLTCFRDKLTEYHTQEDLIKHLFDLYEKSNDRQRFITKLKGEIKKCILFKVPERDRQDNLEDNLNYFSYDDSSQRANIKAILWLFNAWETINASENNLYDKDGQKCRVSVVVRRLPFSQINGNKKDQWTLEHLMPQHPEEDASGDYKKEYNDFKNDMDKAIGQDPSKQTLFFEDAEIHRIGNMALLTKGENSKLSNKNLLAKRKEIIEMVGKGEYIPCSTVNAFSLYYNMLDNTHFYTDFDEKYWTKANRDSYYKKIEECLKAFNY